MVPKRVVNWFNNGRTDEFLQITVAKPMKNGRAQLGCTSNHLIRTPGGWVEAGKLKVGDRRLRGAPALSFGLPVGGTARHSHG